METHWDWWPPASYRRIANWVAGPFDALNPATMKPFCFSCCCAWLSAELAFD